MKEQEVIIAIKKHLKSMSDVTYIGSEYAFIKDGCVSDIIAYSNKVLALNLKNIKRK